MDEAGAPSEGSVRRSKRPRVIKFAAGTGADSLWGGAGDPSEHSIPEDDDSLDDFDEVRPKARRNRAGAAAVPPAAAARVGNQSLIEVVKNNRKLIPHKVKHWFEHYEKDLKAATVDLLTMLFEACGVRYEISGDPDEVDADRVVLTLVDMAKNGEVEDYQSSKKKDFNNFKENLLYFWDSLVIECQNGPIFDKMLFPKCMSYVIALSCTPPRIYRQVASLVGLQLVTSFITVAKMLGSQRETTQRQLNAEKKKQADGPRVESLSKRLSETHEKIMIIEQMMRDIFTGLFVHRYRDVDPNIRMSCIQSLGIWILSYPSLFLKDSYLKYLGWTLNDKNAAVRKAAVIALQSSYEVDENIPSLGLFTERFSNRMIELADDIDIPVAVCAIGLVKQLLRHQLLSDDDLGPLYDLLIDEPPEIRHAIGELVYDHLIAQKSSSQPGSKDVNSLVTLSRMLQILREFSTDPILISYVIDDVWEYMKAMKDWKCIISILLDDTPPLELTENDATNLIRLLFASVRKAVGEKIAPAIDNRKQFVTKAQKEAFENNKRDVTSAMMDNFPQLLRKFMVDKAKIPSLVEIILHMNLELYSLKRQEQNFKEVLQLIREAFFKHGDKDTLRSCVKAISFCMTDSRGELQDFVLSKLKELEDELIAKLKSAMKEAAEGQDEYPLLVNLKRLYELQLSRSVPVDSIYPEFVKMLEIFRDNNDEVVSFLLLNMYLHIAWSLHSIVSSESVSETCLSSLLLKRDTLFKQLGYFLPGSANGEIEVGNHLACRVCLVYADLWCLFRKSNFSNTKLESLGFCPTESTIKQFWRLCEQQLNASSENEEDGNREYLEETNQDAVMIAAGKLIFTDTVPMGQLGPEIISHFMMHGASTSEIIKQLISALRKKDDDLSFLFLESLKRAYGSYAVALSSGDTESAKKCFLDCKELAVRLSGTFMGYGRNKHRPTILNIVKNGVEYAFTDPYHLSFLECGVLHFVSKLSSPDALEILQSIQARTQILNPDRASIAWRPYFTFIDILQEKYAKNEVFGGYDEKEGTSVRRRGRPRKKPNLQGKKLFSGHDSSEEEDASASDQEAPDERNKQRVDEDSEEDAPLIHSIRSSAKLRVLQAMGRDNSGQNAGEGSQRMSGASN